MIKNINYFHISGHTSTKKERIWRYYLKSASDRINLYDAMMDMNKLSEAIDSDYRNAECDEFDQSQPKSPKEYTRQDYEDSFAEVRQPYTILLAPFLLICLNAFIMCLTEVLGRHAAVLPLQLLAVPTVLSIFSTILVVVSSRSLPRVASKISYFNSFITTNLTELEWYERHQHICKVVSDLLLRIAAFATFISSFMGFASISSSLNWKFSELSGNPITRVILLLLIMATVAGAVGMIIWAEIRYDSAKDRGRYNHFSNCFGASKDSLQNELIQSKGTIPAQYLLQKLTDVYLQEKQ